MSQGMRLASLSRAVTGFEGVSGYSLGMWHVHVYVYVFGCACALV
jgi:hypothetical protein